MFTITNIAFDAEFAIALTTTTSNTIGDDDDALVNNSIDDASDVKKAPSKTKRSNVGGVAVVGNVLDVVIQALKRHFADAQVTRQCLSALKNLCCTSSSSSSSSSSNSSSDSLQQFYSAGGCSLLVRVLRTHMEDPDVVKESLLLISNVSLSSHNRSALGASGACSLAVDVLRSQLMNPRVALLGAAALCNLARDVQENKRKLVVCQELDVLKSFHQCYMESEAHLRMYTLALNSLSPL
jgi:hypothetical protein